MSSAKCRTCILLQVVRYQDETGLTSVALQCLSPALSQHQSRAQSGHQIQTMPSTSTRDPSEE
eukprot:312196-Amphidinium_carterae.2